MLQEFRDDTRKKSVIKFEISPQWCKFSRRVLHLINEIELFEMERRMDEVREDAEIRI